MKYKKIIFLLIIQLGCASILYATGLENRAVTIVSSEKFELINGDSIQFQFQPLNDAARTLEITDKASALGVAHVGQIRLEENVTALAALRTIANQISRSLDMNFGIIVDSNTSEALRENDLLLLYHPDVTITLALIKSDEQGHYEIICSYALKEAPQFSQPDVH